MCGGICPEGNPRISTLFVIDTVFLEDDGVLPWPVDPENPAVPSNNAPVPPLLEQSAASTALAEEVSQAETSPPEVGVSQTLPPPSDTLLPLPETSALVPPSASTSAEQQPSTSVNELDPTVPLPPTTFLSTSVLPQETPPATPTSDVSSSTWVTDIPPDSSIEFVTRETLLTETLPEPVPSITPSRDDEPVPSQVLVSESSQFEVPVLTTLGELLLIAVMIA